MELALLIAIIFISVLLLSSPIFFHLFFHKEKEGDKKFSLHLKPKDPKLQIQRAYSKLAKHPNDIKSLKTLATLYFDSGQYSRALDPLKKLKELAAQNKLLNLYEIHRLYGISLAQTGQYDAAYPLLKDCSYIHPKDVLLITNLGILEYRKHLYELAHDRLENIYPLDPSNLEIPKYIGLCLYQTQQYKPAFLYLDIVIHNSIPDSETCFYYALSCYYTNKIPYALEYFEKTRQFPGWECQSLFYIAKIHQQLHHQILSIKYFKDLLSLSNVPPDFFCYAHYAIAMDFIEKKQIPEAFEHLKIIESVKPHYKDIQFLIEQYETIAENANLGAYLLSSSKEFSHLCKRICFQLFPKATFNILELSMTGDQYLDLYAEMTTQEWQGYILFRFVRGTGCIGDLILREEYAKMKEMKAYKAYCFTAGYFSEDCKEFIEGRPIELIEKRALRKILQEMPSVRKPTNDALDPNEEPAKEST